MKALQEIEIEIKQLVDNRNKLKSEEIVKILDNFFKNIKRINIEIARRENEVSEIESIQVDQNCKVDMVKEYKLKNVNILSKDFASTGKNAGITI